MEYNLRSNAEQDAKDCWQGSDHNGQVVIVHDALQELGLEVEIKDILRSATSIYVTYKSSTWVVLIPQEEEGYNYYVYYREREIDRLISLVHSIAAVVAIVTTSTTFK